MNTIIHEEAKTTPQTRSEKALERLERAAEWFERLCAQLADIEDLLDRQRRPYGDGRRN